jgi:hypothetical protein
MAVWRDYVSDFAKYCTEGYNLLRTYREEEVTDIPIDDWYKKRLGDEGYALWHRLRIKRNENELCLYFDSVNTKPILTFNVSDEYYNQLSPPDRKEFERIELIRRQFGIWIDLPSFKHLNKIEQSNRLKANKLAGKVQLLSGTDYFKLNYIKLENNATNAIEPTFYIRKSAQFFDILEILERYNANGKDKEGILVFKPRGVKFTSDVNAFLINKLLMPLRYPILSSIDSGKKTGDSMNEKLNVPMREIPKWLSNKFHPDKKTEASDNAILRLSSIDEDGKIIESHYKIRNAKPNAFDSERASMVYLDEIGLYEYELTKTMSKARATLIDRNRNIIGLFIGGGTSDSNNKNMPTLKNMAFNPKPHKIFTYFVGVQDHRYLDIETGYSDSQRCIDEELENREALSKDATTDALITNCINNAITINDCFYVQGATQIDVVRINRQIINISAEIQRGELNIKRGWLHPTYKELRDDKNTKQKYTTNNILKPIFEPDKKGGWIIIEPPDQNLSVGKPEKFYYAGADNFNKVLMMDEAAKVNEGNLKRSKLAMVVLKTHTKAPVAMYLYRHADPKEDYYQTLLGCLFYNCYMFPETNKENHADFFSPLGDNLFGHIPAGRFGNYLYDTPARFRRRRKGWQKGMDTGATKNELYQNHIVPYFDKYTEEIDIEQLLTACAGWDIENKKNTPDEGMALMLALVGLDDMERMGARTSSRFSLGEINPYDFLKKTYVGALNRI